MLVCGLFLWATFHALAMVDKESNLGDTQGDTPADYTLMLRDLPPAATCHDELAAWCAAYGTVTHAVVVLEARELLLRQEPRRELLDQLQTAQAALYLERTRKEPRTVSLASLSAYAEARRIEARADAWQRVEAAAERLVRHDQAWMTPRPPAALPSVTRCC